MEIEDASATPAAPTDKTALSRPPMSLLFLTMQHDSSPAPSHFYAIHCSPGSTINHVLLT